MIAVVASLLILAQSIPGAIKTPGSAEFAVILVHDPSPQ